MSYATQSSRAAIGGSLPQRVAALRSALAERFARYQTYRQTLAELAELNDRDLSDLGIHRSDIRGIARDAAYRA